MMEYDRFTKHKIADGKGVYEKGVHYIEKLQSDTSMLHRLAELEDELESGKIVRLPCKVGDTVYKILYVFGDRKIVQFKVSKISIDEKEILIFFRKSKKSWQEWCTKPQHLGSNVFLTREEAEAKLKEQHNVRQK